MQNKSVIRLFAILLALACVYYFSFTYFSTKTENAAKEYAADYVSQKAVVDSAQKAGKGDTVKTRFYLDSMRLQMADDFLKRAKDSVVYGLFGFTYEECKEKSINLGLDLKGGMNVTLEISEADIIRGMSGNNKDIVFNQAINQAEDQHLKSTKPFIDLFSEDYAQLKPDGKLATYFQTMELRDAIPPTYTNEQVIEELKKRIADAIGTAQLTLRARIDKFGVAQPNIQVLPGSGRILIGLPGVSDKDRVRKLLQGSANLEFWETYSNEKIYPYLARADQRLAALLNAVPDTTKKSATDTSKNAITKTADTGSHKSDTGVVASNNKAPVDTLNKKNDTSRAAIAKKDPLFAVFQAMLVRDQQNHIFPRKGPEPEVGYTRIADTGKVGAYLRMPQIASIFPTDLKFLWEKPKDKSASVLELVAIKTLKGGGCPLSGDIIADAKKQFDQMNGGSPSIEMTMTPQAGQVWRRLTNANKGACIAIVLDNVVYSAPVVQNEIPNGISQITGSYKPEEADDLVNILKAGRLPAPAHIVEESVVGPTLGKESISSGLLSFLVALLFVLAFMAFYYNQAGRVADAAMIINVFFVLGILASLGAVLTLPGIAGIVLTVAMSVDANILIFERIREELSHGGKTLANAVKDGFKNARSSVLDSNITTFILGIILYVYGTGPIQGFATTLIIGIPSSLFCAMFLTRLMFERSLSKNKEIKFDTSVTRNLFKNININFVKRRKYYYIISGSILLCGLASYLHSGFHLGVDFKGGRSYVVRFNNPPSVENVRKTLKVAFGGEDPEVQTYGEPTQIKITTAYLVNDQSKDAESKAEGALKSGLAPLRFDVDYKIMSSQLVGESVSHDIKSKAVWSVLLACLLMFIFIFIRFRGWQYGLGAVVALFHDALMIMAVFTLFKDVVPFSLEVNQDFIAAILTVMSYSMTDTVVVFDRIREYLTSKKKRELAQGEDKTEIINYALNATLSRTINTSMSIFFVLLAIFIFGGTTIKGFAFALLVGIVVGTYSSICIATPIVIDFDRKKKEPIPAK
jgi:SecD/SecF fusion protein